MSLLEALRLALATIRANPLRSGLTMLGVVIGVAAVIAMVTVGLGARSYIARQMESLGSDVLLVLPAPPAAGATGAPRSLTQRDALLLKREVIGVQTAAPTISAPVRVVAGNRNWPTMLQGIDADYVAARRWRTVEGRLFTATEYRHGTRMVILGATVARRLFGELNPLGQRVRVNRVPLEVVGVLEDKGHAATGGDQNDLILIPLTTARSRVLGRPPGPVGRVDVIVVGVADTGALTRVTDQIRQVLSRHRRNDGSGVQVVSMTDQLQVQSRTTDALNLLLIVVAGVSLLVGGIGIMNIMLVSVTERTREIGLRRAVGARRADVMRQFLMESATLCLLGGIVGMLAGLALGGVLATAIQVPFVPSPTVIVLTGVASAALGIAFGYYPARIAASREPAAALRYE